MNDHHEDPNPEEILFDAGEQSVVTGGQTGEWANTEEGDWAPPENLGDLDEFIGGSPGGGIETSDLHGVPAGADGGRRNPMPSAEQDDERLGGMRRSPHLEEQAAGIQREALPSLHDAPVYAPRLIQESRPMAWILPCLIFFFGTSTGAVMYLTDTNPILGGMAAGLSVVGALFLRLVMRS